jgi:hypothetical protein
MHRPEHLPAVLGWPLTHLRCRLPRLLIAAGGRWAGRDEQVQQGLFGDADAAANADRAKLAAGDRLVELVAAHTQDGRGLAGGEHLGQRCQAAAGGAGPTQGRGGGGGSGRRRVVARLVRWMSVACTGLPHTHRTTATQDRSSDRDNTAALAGRPPLPAPDHHTAVGNGSRPSLTAALGCVSWSPTSAPPAPASMHARWRPRPGSANAAPMSCSARSGLKTSSHNDPLPGPLPLRTYRLGQAVGSARPGPPRTAARGRRLRRGGPAVGRLIPHRSRPR